MTVDAGVRAGRREWIGLAVLALPTMLLTLDLSVLFLAVPHLTADLGASNTEQLWITDIYGFMTAGFLITMGYVGDRVGRRRLMLIGAAVFAVASVAAAYASTPEMLIAIRALLGVAGACVLPSTLALIQNMFRDPRQLGLAIAGWTTAYMVGVALGPVIGGALLENFWWGSVFLLGVPVMVLLLVLGPALLPEFRDPAPGRLDLVSVALSLAAILPVIWGLKSFAADGWRAAPLLAILAGAVIGTLFVLRQRRLTVPLLDLSLFGIRTVRATLIMAVLIGAIQNGGTFIVATFLQTVKGQSPLEAGLWLMLPALALIAVINTTPHLVRRFRPGYVYAAGLVGASVGYLLLSQVSQTGGLTLVVLGAVIAYAGIGTAGPLTNQLVMGAVPPERAGSAASLTTTAGEFGIALGIATLGSVGTAVYRTELQTPAGLPPEAAERASESISDAVVVAADQPAAIGAELLQNAQAAFTGVLNAMGGISTVLYLLVALTAAIVLRHVLPTGATPPAPAPDAGADTEPARVGTDSPTA